MADANRLKARRMALGLSQEELSIKSGINRYTISELEAGKCPNSRLSTLIKLADALDATVEALFL